LAAAREAIDASRVNARVNARFLWGEILCFHS
jgi:hypothetical protein